MDMKEPKTGLAWLVFLVLPISKRMELTVLFLFLMWFF